MESRDLAWQEEKQEILAEVQRLKEEASRMVAILTMEAEDEMGEEKKRSLQQEVESLQLVVEMRTAEVKRLRDQQAKMERQLEEFEVTREQLRTMKARVEDLQEQLVTKQRLERQLSLEKSQLEIEMEAEAKAAARMSLEVEQLQWRIRHNLELPPTQVQFRRQQEALLEEKGTEAEHKIWQKPHAGHHELQKPAEAGRAKAERINEQAADVQRYFLCTKTLRRINYHQKFFISYLFCLHLETVKKR